MTEITEAGRQLAADLANAARTRKGYSGSWTANHFTADGIGSAERALARLATQSIARDAELAEAKADLREIDRLIGEDSMGWIPKAQNIAAKHREADPLVEAIQAVWEYAKGCGHMSQQRAEQLRAELAKRGIELTTNPADRRMAWLTNTA